MKKRIALLVTASLLCLTSSFADLLPSVDVNCGKNPVIYENATTGTDMTITVQATAGCGDAFVKSGSVIYKIPAATTKACLFKVRPHESVILDCIGAGKGMCKYSIDPCPPAQGK